MREGIIYKVTNIINNKVYIGQTTLSLSRRKSIHLYCAFTAKHNTLFYRVLRKRGVESFKWSIIWKGDISLLDAQEIFYIDKYKSFYKNGNGYNFTIGGKNYSNSNHPSIDHTKYTFYHYNGLIERDVNRYYMCDKYNLPREAFINIIYHKDKHSHGWKLTHWKTYNLYHEHGTFELNITKPMFYKKYNFNNSPIKQLFNGKVTTSCGWSLIPYNTYTLYHVSGKIEENITLLKFRHLYNISATDAIAITRGYVRRNWGLYKHNTYSFIHTNGTIVTNVTTEYMCKTYNVTDITKVVSGRYKTTKGWKLIN
jgi:hypothetical protein